MTANELADELDKSRQKPYTFEHLVGKAANMLRQFGLAESIVKQQALDIEEWKRKYKDMHNLATQAMSKVHQLEKEAQMNNKPVAWMYYDAWNKLKLGKTMPPDSNWFPVYTHPAKCNKCNDTEWVCENHPDQEAHKCSHCEGAGKPCECTHPAKELHLSLQKSKETGELLAVTYTDDEHRIVEVLWQKPPAKTLTDFEIRGVMALDECWVGEDCSIPNMIAFARAILRKAQEK